VRALLIDDEEDIRKIGRMSLTAVGKIPTVVAASAAEGLALARAEPPDVILMDVMMPGMDGPTALGELRRDPRLAHIPVVFMTARVQRTDVERYLSLGVLGVIQKPFDPMTLAAEVLRLLSTRRG
jgi:CheY-like chemotaxis protein